MDLTDAIGKRVRRFTGTTDRKQAEGLEAEWELLTFKQQQWDEQPSRTFDELILEYLKETKEKKSHQRDLNAAVHVDAHFSGRELNGSSASDVRAYVERRKKIVKNASVNREQALLSTAINYARREWDRDIPNPVSGRKLKEPEGRARWISRAQGEALMRAAETESNAPHLAVFIRLALHTGCRIRSCWG